MIKLLLTSIYAATYLVCEIFAHMGHLHVVGLDSAWSCLMLLATSIVRHRVLFSRTWLWFNQNNSAFWLPEFALLSKASWCRFVFPIYFVHFHITKCSQQPFVKYYFLSISWNCNIFSKKNLFHIEATLLPCKCHADAKKLTMNNDAASQFASKSS